VCGECRFDDSFLPRFDKGVSCMLKLAAATRSRMRTGRLYPIDRRQDNPHRRKDISLQFPFDNFAG
jgi:hypothetical protein